MAVTQARNSDLTQKQEEAFQQLLPRFKRSGLIRALLLARGIPQRDICTRHGFRLSEVCSVISGDRHTPAVRKAIADELNLPYDVLWTR